MLKNKYIIGILVMILSGLTEVNSQIIENLRFAQEGKMINITYDLLSEFTGQTFDVQVYLSTDGGKGLQGPLTKLSGDHGEGISAGIGKTIIWDVLEEMEKLNAEVFFELLVKPEGNRCVDFDGNSYKTIKLGNQTWMAENLKVIHYPDGSAIPLVTDKKAWANLENNNTDDAYCYYKNNISSENGALYTYAAALKACPAGWHLPSDAEWTELENFLAENGYNYDSSTGGGQGKIAKAMAKATGWSSSITSGAVGNTDYYEMRNASKFSASPGGYRFGNGAFLYADYIGYWWSATDDSSSNAWARRIHYESSGIFRGSLNKENGFSVRCVRDE